MEKSSHNCFNCAESVLIGCNRELDFHDFSPTVMRVASMFGGGIVGTGETCGAVTGALMYLGLVLGTDGSEPHSMFKARRTETNQIGLRYIKEFIEAWGSQRCSVLQAMDKGLISPTGSQRLDDSIQGSKCNTYVRWAVEQVTRMLIPYLST